VSHCKCQKQCAPRIECLNSGKEEKIESSFGFVGELICMTGWRLELEVRTRAKET
jgi:hypothetical protein